MRPALDLFFPPTPEQLTFAKQIGVDDVVLFGTSLESWSELSFKNLIAIRNRVEDAGLRLFSIETFPARFYDRIMLGKPAGTEQLRAYQEAVDNMGRAGIRHHSYNWMPTGVWRTTYSHRLRGGARGIAFNQADIDRAPLSFDRVYEEEEFWDHYSRFITELLPVAESADVKLSVHPNDPPIASIGGVPQLFRSREAFDRALALRPSGHHGLTFCLGGWSAMGFGATMADVIRAYGPQGKLHYVHFQSHNGVPPFFSENFAELADYNPFAVVRALQEVGFDGVMIPGHVPQLDGDSEWRNTYTVSDARYTHPMGGHRARAYTIGFMKGLISALNA
ncbi:mannonate dehydratase [Larkinella soli]|uniref:mannonate dehydratase n=1 Tax=Larkinella soli TaxID=1770527 RepID=UPI000FFB1A82|nr:mannonate dehydratase [Larkinella soli]